jgi:hypothetical protein
VEWEEQSGADFSAELRLEVANKRGVLATIAAAISATDTNIETINTTERDGTTTTVSFAAQCPRSGATGPGDAPVAHPAGNAEAGPARLAVSPRCSRKEELA